MERERFEWRGSIASDAVCLVDEHTDDRISITSTDSDRTEFFLHTPDVARC